MGVCVEWGEEEQKEGCRVVGVRMGVKVKRE